ncbi:MAG: hypothetical protein JWL68_2614 [Actinomycetia bacterium]|nr:hypothetical protein [Actinomycetes bacterium]
MSTPLLICVKALVGGLFVTGFAVLGEMLQPKRFAGIFGASPAVALANLLVIALAKSEGMARDAATGMIAGAVGLAVACAAGVPAVRRWGAVRGSGALWGVWILVGGGTAVPIAAGAAAGSGTGLPAGRRTRRRRPKTDKSSGEGGDRLFAIDLGAVREIRPGALALRFVFGAAISVVAGLIGTLAGQRAGGVMLAAPVVLSATLTIIEREEGRRPAVAEVQGAVPGAVALIGFALAAAGGMATLPLAAALIAALATWVAVAIAGYLAQSALLPVWHQEVRDLALQRRAAELARRALTAAGAQQASG